MGEASALAQPGRGAQSLDAAARLRDLPGAFRRRRRPHPGDLPAADAVGLGARSEPAAADPPRQRPGAIWPTALGVPPEVARRQGQALSASAACRRACLRSSCSRCRAISLFSTAPGGLPWASRRSIPPSGSRSTSASRRSSPSAGGCSTSAGPTCSRGCRKALRASRSCCSSCSIICPSASPSTTGGPAAGSRTGPRARASRSRPGQDAPLELAGRLVQEDLCLMQRGEAGYRLVAAVLCFPAHWRLSDKLGRPLEAIHGPVPGFGERLAATVDRFFASIQVARPVWRVNWSLVDTPDLFLPPEHRGHPTPISAERAGAELWLRVERQTLRRLPALGRRRVRDPHPRRPARGRDRFAGRGARARRAHPRDAGRHGALQEHPADPRAACSPGSRLAPRLRGRAPAGRDRPGP